jgi:hypothetical protein
MDKIWHVDPNYWRRARWLELLGRIKEWADICGNCPCCEMVWVDGYYHTDDCELAKALVSEQREELE